MKTQINTNETISLSLSADECEAIARALDVAISETCKGSTLVWRAMKQAFESHALALNAYANLSPAQQQELQQQSAAPRLVKRATIDGGFRLASVD